VAKKVKIRRSLSFTIEKAFPSSDSVSVYFLLLQGAYNDLQFMGEWVDSNPKNQTGKHARIIGGIRWSLQLRLWASIIYEALEVLDKAIKNQEFMRLASKMDSEAQNALTRLTSVWVGDDRTTKKCCTLLVTGQLIITTKTRFRKHKTN